MQRNVTWQTGSEYRSLTVSSCRILIYVSFVRKIQIPEIFGFPYVCWYATCSKINLLAPELFF